MRFARRGSPVRVSLLLASLLLAGCNVPEAPRATSATTAVPTDAPPCARISLDANESLLRVGHNVTLRVALHNCGATALRVRPNGPCFGDAALRIVIEDGTGEYELYAGLANGTPIHAGLFGFSRGACLLGASASDRLLVLPGESFAEELSWNGTLARAGWCIGEDPRATGYGVCAKDARAEPGAHVVRARFEAEGVPAATAETTLHVEGVGRRETRLLLVREHDWANATREVPRAAPHCDDAEFENGTLVLHREGARVDDYATLRTFRERSTTEYRALGPEGGWLASPYSAQRAVLQVYPDGERVFVDNTLVPPGGELVVRVELDGAEHVLVVRDAGVVPVVRRTIDCD